MPNKEDPKTRKRIVVEEFQAEQVAKPEILHESAKVSSQDLISNEGIQLTNEAPQVSKKTSSPVLWIVIPGIFLLGAILGGIVFYQKGVNKSHEETPSPIASMTPLPTPSASPSASVDLTKYSISILNGSGIAGEANKVKTLLTGAGFKVGSTANAATYDYTKTIIKAKNTVEVSFITALSNALGKTYVVDTLQNLASSSADSVQVIVGTSKAVTQ